MSHSLIWFCMSSTSKATSTLSTGFNVNAQVLTIKLMLNTHAQGLMSHTCLITQVYRVLRGGKVSCVK